MAEKKKEKKLSFWQLIAIIFLVFLFFNFLFSDSNNSRDVEELESDIRTLKSKVNCLDNYINYLQGELKKNPNLVSYSKGDVVGALSIYFPSANC